MAQSGREIDFVDPEKEWLNVSTQTQSRASSRQQKEQGNGVGTGEGVYMSADDEDDDSRCDESKHAQDIAVWIVFAGAGTYAHKHATSVLPKFKFL
jgi:hypothetical protein